MKIAKNYYSIDILKEMEFLANCRFNPINTINSRPYSNGNIVNGFDNC